MRRHCASIAHKTRGRIRLKIPAAASHPELLGRSHEEFAKLPGLLRSETRQGSGSIILYYDPKQQSAFEQRFEECAGDHFVLHGIEAPEDVGRIADEVAAGAAFLAKRSSLAKAIFDGCRGIDRELKIVTGNTLDLKIVITAGLAAYTLFKLPIEAGTPMWVTLAIFAVNHLVELHGEPSSAGGVI